MRELGPHQKYVAWLRLTHNGRILPDRMPRRDRLEFEKLGLRVVTPLPGPMSEEQRAAAKERYEAACAESDSSR